MGLDDLVFELGLVLPHLGSEWGEGRLGLATAWLGTVWFGIAWLVSVLFRWGDRWQAPTKRLLLKGAPSEAG